MLDTIENDAEYSETPYASLVSLFLQFLTKLAKLETTPHLPMKVEALFCTPTTGSMTSAAWSNSSNYFIFPMEMRGGSAGWAPIVNSSTYVNERPCNLSLCYGRSGVSFPASAPLRALTSPLNPSMSSLKHDALHLAPFQQLEAQGRAPLNPPCLTHDDYLLTRLLSYPTLYSP
jgi:hypothetical protein